MIWCTCVARMVYAQPLSLWAQNTHESMRAPFATSSTQLCRLQHCYQATTPTVVNVVEQHCSLNYLDSSHWNSDTRQFHACQPSSHSLTAFRRHSSSIWACQCNRRVSSTISCHCTRGCIAMLRLLFKIAHGFTHPSFQDVIPQIEIDFKTIIRWVL